MCLIMPLHMGNEEALMCNMKKEASVTDIHVSFIEVHRASRDFEWTQY